MALDIRVFEERDIDALVEILKLNHQYDYPEVEGPDAMRRVARCACAVFLVAAIDQEPCGLIRAVYDGSRALIHLLSVHPERQHSGIGAALVDAAWQELRRRGAAGVSATVTERSLPFWNRAGFSRLPVLLALRTAGQSA
jgi:GNAT superfamily N-acetyltransferase